MKALTLGLFFLLALSVATFDPAVFADEDDNDAERMLGGGIPDAILYGTIAIIVASVAYAGFKIYKAKRPKISASR